MPSTTNTPIYWLKHFGSIVLLSIGITVLNIWGREMNPVDVIKNLTYTFTICTAMWLGNGWITGWLSARFSWVTQPGLRFGLGVLCMVLYTLGITLLILESLEWFNDRELPATIYWQSLLISMIVTSIISIILHARSFLLNWRQAAIDKERLEKAHVASQYQSLRNQINPHFLFNSLNALSELVHQDAHEAERFIHQLNHVYRYVLAKREMEVVSLQEELDFLKSYLFLHEIRQPHTLLVQWPQEAKEEVGLPPLALQLLAENALKHNVQDQQKPLQLLLRLQDGQLVVENNLQKRLTPSSGTGIGLSNLTKRYHYLTSKPINIEETDGWYRVCLPLLKLPTP